MFAEIKFAFKTATSAKDLYSLVTGKQLLESLELLGDVHLRTAIRMWNESCELQGQARSGRRRSALEALEHRYTVLGMRAGLPWWRGLQGAVARSGVYGDASNVAFTIAILRRELDGDPRSAQSPVDNAIKMFMRYEKIRRNSIESSCLRSMRSTWKSGPGGHPLPGKLVAQAQRACRSLYEAELRALDSKLRAANSLAAEILS